MDYQFTRNHNALPVAKFSMGNEALSRWFTEELGRDSHQINLLQQVIEQLESGQLREYQLSGQEFILNLNTDEVDLHSKALESDGPKELPEGTELYDQESLAGCGLADFKQVLKSWQEFIRV